MATAPSINRDWILAEFSKGIDAENTLQVDAKETAASRRPTLRLASSTTRSPPPTAAIA